MPPTTCSIHTRYTAGCNGCRTYARIQARRYRRDKATGRWAGFVDAEPARLHIRAVLDSGKTISEIAVETGFSKNCIYNVVSGTRGRPPARRIHPTTADTLLAVAPSTHRMRCSHWRDATGTRRRIAALRAIGWSTPVLAQHLGVGKTVVSKWGAARLVYASTAERIAVLYERLSMVDGPSHETRVKALRAGCPPPSWWGDDTIDDPSAEPREPGNGPAAEVSDLLDMQVHVDRAVNGHLTYEQLTHAERGMAVRRLNRAGFNDAEIGRRLHTSTDTAGRRRMRMRLPSNFLPTSNYSRSA